MTMASEDNFKMYPREWVDAANDPKGKFEDASFSVASYNILADCFMHPEDYQYCPQKIRYMDGRHPRIMVEIDVINADIVCMQVQPPDCLCVV